ncbi:MAG: single-stranded DNA-binding protein [Epsilonproteobacteria bacterium]|nr:single-stranded DNA-binding protein [Campylobacterota bacterium]
MYNRVILVGNLTRDPELRYMPNGGAVCTIGIATNRKYKKQDGSAGEEVCFVDVTFFARTAEVANQYLKKGSKILVEGRLKLDQWVDQNGGKRSKHSVVADNMQMLDSKGSSEGGYNQNSAPTSGSYSNNQQTNHKQPAQVQSENIPDINIDEDEIPF